MLKIELRPGEAISIGSAIVTLEAKSGQMARLSVQADKSVPVHRLPRPSGVANMVAEQGITRKP